MKDNTKIIQPLLAIFISIFLSSCGGGVISIVEGGISGTGITSIGRITAFGSIYVNGIRFDVDNASFTRDGKVSLGQSEFSIGEYIVITGTVNADKISGVASEVLFTDIIEGEVTKAANNSLSLEVLGQVINVTNLTSLHNFNNLNDLVAGNLVEVSGIKNASGISTATSIKLKEDSFEDGSENELKGNVSNINVANKTFQINTITIDYAGAELKGFNNQSLQNGQYVEVKSVSKLVNSILVANEIELEEDEHLNINESIEEGTEVELEGLVTRFVSITDFDVNGLKITTDSKTEFHEKKSNDIGLNVFLEVKGLINASGVLVAKEVSFDSEDEPSSDDSSDDSSDENSNEDTKVDRENLVTRFVSITDFDVNGLKTTIDSKRI